jgi:hypothetical protein
MRIDIEIKNNIEIKNKLEENYNFFIEMWSWKENQFNKRIKKIKRMRIKLEKKNYMSQIGIEKWNWKQIRILQKS